MSEADSRRLAQPDYWDKRYAETGPENQLHEWFRSFDELVPFLDRRLFRVRSPETAPMILHLGSGDSTFPEDFSKKGYKSQLCIDFSHVIVDSMSKRHSNIEGITWKHADVRCLTDIPTASIDIAFDKGTLDAMIYGSPWDPPKEVLDNTSSYIRELFRVLKSDGRFIYVTYRQPHFIKPLLSAEGTQWNVVVDLLGESESSLGYYGFVLEKTEPS